MSLCHDRGKTSRICQFVMTPIQGADRSKSRGSSSFAGGAACLKPARTIPAHAHARACVLSSSKTPKQVTTDFHRRPRSAAALVHLANVRPVHHPLGGVVTRLLLGALRSRSTRGCAADVLPACGTPTRIENSAYDGVPGGRPACLVREAFTGLAARAGGRGGAAVRL
eukprot:COSAG06_NODE_7195_length_2589_cov_1.346185_1_plen_168_part_00